MDLDPLQLSTHQPALFPLEDSQPGVLELFPAVWSAAEACTYPDVQVRREGYQRLETLGAARLSPLIAYFLYTRVLEPEVELRFLVTRMLAAVLRRDEAGGLAPEPVRQVLKYSLSQIDIRQVMTLLEVSDRFPESEADLTVLFSASSLAGVPLGAILADRSIPLGIRRQAVYFIGIVGYLDAQSTLERLASRLEARLAGQQSMPFIPVEENDETTLLPAIQDSLALLKAP